MGSPLGGAASFATFLTLLASFLAFLAFLSFLALTFAFLTLFTFLTFLASFLASFACGSFVLRETSFVSVWASLWFLSVGAVALVKVMPAFACLYFHGGLPFAFTCSLSSFGALGSSFSWDHPSIPSAWAWCGIVTFSASWDASGVGFSFLFA